MRIFELCKNTFNSDLGNRVFWKNASFYFMPTLKCNKTVEGPKMTRSFCELNSGSTALWTGTKTWLEKG